MNLMQRFQQFKEFTKIKVKKDFIGAKVVLLMDMNHFIF